MNESSLLTRERPELWQSAVNMAARLTGMVYRPKLPLPDGTIYACGGSVGYSPPPTPAEKEAEENENRRREIADLDRQISEYTELLKRDNIAEWLEKQLRINRAHAKRVKKQLEAEIAGCLSVYVPVGAMEWLLHEVGHYVAATPTERLILNYGLVANQSGHDGDREWQALAFEEIILAPYAPARTLVPPSQRDVAAFAANGPMPAGHLRHIERQIEALGIDVEMWRIVWGDWFRWGTDLRDRAPWANMQ